MELQVKQPSEQLRNLRLWHWRQFREARVNEDMCVGWLYRSINHDKATFHLLAVQALNDCFPIGDNVEADDNEQQTTKALHICGAAK